MSSSDLKSKNFSDVYNNTKDYPTTQDVANKLGVAHQTVKNTASLMRKMFAEGTSKIQIITRRISSQPRVGDIEIEEIPSAEEPIEELIDRAIRHNDRLTERANRRNIVDINLHIEGPFGIVGLPDQHLNNPGTALRKAFSDAEIINSTEGLYCVAVGDWLDNFIIGRLERERRSDIMPHSDSNRLQEHYLTMIADKLLAAIGGNHNDWIGNLGGTDVLDQLFRRLGKQGIYDADEMRVRINVPSGHSFMHLVRHIFPGHSKYNTAHGVLAWMLDRWQGEDCLWGGHIHSSAHVAIEREHLGESKVVHGMQLSTYKMNDKYAVSKGFRKNSPFIAPMIIHTPGNPKAIFFEDVEEGVDYLKFLRKNFKEKSTMKAKVSRSDSSYSRLLK